MYFTFPNMVLVSWGMVECVLLLLEHFFHQNPKPEVCSSLFPLCSLIFTAFNPAEPLQGAALLL